jgi:uncharacterized protein (TIGR00369 family)
MKKVCDSSITVVQHMTQQDANLAGNVHGGTIMKLIDNTAGIVAARHCGSNVVTASIDRIDFHYPVFVGELLRITGSINFVGKSSMEVGVRIESENMFTGQVKHTGSAYLTFVSLDGHGKPAPVQPIVFETDDEIKRNCEARERRKNRLAERQAEKREEGCKE